MQDLSFKLQARDLELTRCLQYKKFLNPLEKSNLMRVAGVNDGKMCAMTQEMVLDLLLMLTKWYQLFIA